MRVNRGNFDHYLSLRQTTCINGVFVVLVFMSHFIQYIVIVDTITVYRPILFILSHLGQLIVAPFLFYSGYGIMEQIKNNGQAYINSIPKKRIFKTWIHFSLAVLMFLIINYIQGIHYNYGRLFLSFLAWESIGNSNWYIFAIIFLYIVTYLGFKYFKNSTRSIIFVVLLSSFYILFMYIFKDGKWWYDTIMCYSAGLSYSYYKEIIEEKIKKYNANFLFLIVFLTLILYFFQSNILVHELLSILFCLDIVVFCLFIRVENDILFFLGRHTFEIYILQRIPMIVLLNYFDGYSYLILCLFFTITLSVVFKYIERKVDLFFKL